MFFLFQHSNMSVKRKLNIRSLCEKCTALKNLESGLFNKEVVTPDSRCNNNLAHFIIPDALSKNNLSNNKIAFSHFVIRNMLKKPTKLSCHTL